MKNSELFQIGEVSRLFHISVSILRHYDRIGLLKPEYTDPDTGYRYYSTRQFECLNTIRYLRALDMPLEQISTFLQNRDPDTIHNLLIKQKEAVSRRRQELLLIERKIDNRLSQIDDALSSRPGGNYGFPLPEAADRIHTQTGLTAELSGSGTIHPAA